MEKEERYTIDFIAVPTVPFKEAILKARTGSSGKFIFNPKKIEAVHKVRRNERWITGYETKKRLNRCHQQSFNSNLIRFLVDNQDDVVVKEFLDQYRKEIYVLVCLDDTFLSKYGDEEFIATMYLKEGRWTLSNGSLGSAWGENTLTFVLKKDLTKKHKLFQKNV